MSDFNERENDYDDSYRDNEYGYSQVNNGIQDSLETHRFTLQGNSVVSVQEFDDGYWKTERIERNETYSFDGKYITKTETERYGTEVTKYVDADGDGIYAAINSSGVGYDDLSRYEYANDGSRRYEQYKFTVNNGEVTEIFETKSGQLKPEYPDWNETYSIDGSEIVKIEAEYYGSEVTRYQDLDGDGYYTEVSYDWLPRQQAAGITSEQLLSVSNMTQSQVGTEFNDNLLGTDGDDYLFSGNGDDRVDALDGDDLIVGGSGAGNDIYSGGNGLDTIKYTSATRAIKVDLSKGFAKGADIDKDSILSVENVIAGLGNDTLVGDSTANIFNGQDGNDKINGGGGDDVLIGGLGADELRGGLGADVFKFESLLELGIGANRDRVKDFSGVQGDQIDLSLLDLNLTFYSSKNDVINPTGAVWFEKGILKISSDSDMSPEYEIGLSGVSTFNQDYLVL